MINVALIGAGYWGSKYGRVLESMEDVNLKWVHKRNLKGYSHPVLTDNIDDILKDWEVDCVIIATPAATHFEIAKKCIEANKHCLVEKPFTLNTKEAKKLIKLNKNNLVLMPGHIYLHHPGIQKLKELIDFDVKTAFSKRMSLSKYPNSVNEIAVHDFYIFEYLLGENFSIKKTMGNIEHCIFNLEFPHPVYHKTDVYIEAASDYPGKIREIILKGDEKRILFNEVEKHIAITDLITKKVIFESWDSHITPLEKQCKHFFDCVKGLDTPIINEEDGLHSVEKIEQLFFKLTFKQI